MVTQPPKKHVVSFTANRRLRWPVYVQRGLLDRTPAEHPTLFGDLTHSRRRFLVIDETVFRLYGDRILQLLARYGIEHNEPLLIPGGEAAKSQATLDRIWEAMEKWGVQRLHEPLLVWGGGVLHDVAGLAAAGYRRGVPYICYATTLVSAIDACYALKTAINTLWKNRIGAYHPPLAAYVDPEFFATLDHAQILDGTGEIYKVGIALDGKLFRLLEKHGARAVTEKFQGHDAATLKILILTLEAMSAELSGNPYEHNPARRSYAGHNISPGMEPEVTHGVAVALDLIWSTMVSWRRAQRAAREPFTTGWLFTGYRRHRLTTRQRDRIVELAQTLGLPTWHPVLKRTDNLARALADTARHRGGEHRVPAPAGRPGKVSYLNRITDAELNQGLVDQRTVSAAWERAE